MLLFQILDGRFDLIAILAFVAALLLAITVHEFSHAAAAAKLGDPTAKNLGRLTLNPVAHLDPIGTLAILLVGFGWGKPVPFDPAKLANPKKDSAIISLAGPASNLVLALVLSIPYQIGFWTNLFLPQIFVIYSVIVTAIWLNLILAVFNLVPVHPLDGFKVLGGLLPKNWYDDFQQMANYGLIILLFLILPVAGEPFLARIILPIVSLILSLLLPNLGG